MVPVCVLEARYRFDAMGCLRSVAGKGDKEAIRLLAEKLVHEDSAMRCYAVEGLGKVAIQGDAFVVEKIFSNNAFV